MSTEGFDGPGLDELVAIRSLMEESQSFLSGTWPHQLVWGAIGAAGVTGTWGAAATGHVDWIPWIWIVAVGAGWAFSLGGVGRGASLGRVRNVASRAFGGVWMALGVTLTLLGAVAVGSAARGTPVVDPQILPGLIALIFGAGYFASGYLAGLRWLQGVALLWWSGGVGLLLWRHHTALLVLAVMTILLEIGPALVLRRSEREERAEA